MYSTVDIVGKECAENARKSKKSKDQRLTHSYHNRQQTVIDVCGDNSQIHALCCLVEYMLISVISNTLVSSRQY